MKLFRKGALLGHSHLGSQTVGHIKLSLSSSVAMENASLLSLSLHVRQGRVHLEPHSFQTRLLLHSEGGDSFVWFTNRYC